MPNECLMNHDEQLVRREATINLYEGYDRVPSCGKGSSHDWDERSLLGFCGISRVSLPLHLLIRLEHYWLALVVLLERRSYLGHQVPWFLRRLLRYQCLLTKRQSSLGFLVSHTLPRPLPLA